MTKEYKIFAGETEILISGKINSLNEQSKITFKPTGPDEIKIIADFLKNKPVQKKVEIISAQPGKIFSLLKKQFNIIRAAGGIVRNKKGEILFIYKNEIWDLPKGKIDVNEKKKDAAIREVSEECGVTRLIITGLYGKTWHIGKAAGSIFLKKTYWYVMTCDDELNIRPQAEENITDIKWIDLRNNMDFLNGTYANLRELLLSIL